MCRQTLRNGVRSSGVPEAGKPAYLAFLIGRAKSTLNYDILQLFTHGHLLSRCTDCGRVRPSMRTLFAFSGRGLRSQRVRHVAVACSSSGSWLDRRSLALRPAHALSPIRDTLTEGFSQFVSSMTAPFASGWSGCRVGFAPTRRLFTAHTRSEARSSSGPPFNNATGPVDRKMKVATSVTSGVNFT
jgi:hypothetical protein